MPLDIHGLCESWPLFAPCSTRRRFSVRVGLADPLTSAELRSPARLYASRRAALFGNRTGPNRPQRSWSSTRSPLAVCKNGNRRRPVTPPAKVEVNPYRPPRAGTGQARQCRRDEQHRRADEQIGKCPAGCWISRVTDSVPSIDESTLRHLFDADLGWDSPPSIESSDRRASASRCACSESSQTRRFVSALDPPSRKTKGTNARLEPVDPAVVLPSGMVTPRLCDPKARETW